MRRLSLLKSSLCLNLVLLFMSPAMRAAEADLHRFVMGLPKAELHIHMEGTMEPEQYLLIAARNGIDSPYPDPEAVRERLRSGHDLPSFIEVYEELIGAIQTPQDIRDITLAFFRKAHSQGVRRVEMYFDPQLHLERGMTLASIFEGLAMARNDAMDEMDISIGYIMAFLRDRPAEDAASVLEASRPWHDQLLGVGLDNPEVTDFPQKFQPVFARAKSLGLRLTSHCDVGQENTIAHHWGVLDVLGVERIDHGLNVLDDPELLAAVKARGIGLTGVPSLFYRDIPGRMEYRAGAIKGLLDAGAEISIHSDYPGMKRGLYVGDLMLLVQEETGMTKTELAQLARNSFHTAWISDEERQHYLAMIDEYVATFDQD